MESGSVKGKSRLWILVALLALVIAGSGYYIYKNRASADVADTSSNEVAPVASYYPGVITIDDRLSKVIPGAAMNYTITVNYKMLTKALLGKDVMAAMPTAAEVTNWAKAHPNDRFYIRAWLGNGKVKDTGKMLLSNPNYSVEIPFPSDKNMESISYSPSGKAPNYSPVLAGNTVINSVRLVRYDCGQTKNCTANSYKRRISDSLDNDKMDLAQDAQSLSLGYDGRALFADGGDVYALSSTISDQYVQVMNSSQVPATGVKLKLYVDTTYSDGNDVALVNPAVASPGTTGCIYEGHCKVYTVDVPLVPGASSNQPGSVVINLQFAAADKTKAAQADIYGVISSTAANNDYIVYGDAYGTVNFRTEL